MCYELALESYRVRKELDDGVFSPSSKLFVEHLVVHNAGGMECPAGCELTVKSTDDCVVCQSPLVLPAIPAGHKVHKLS